MKISTTIATHYLLRMIFLVALPCFAFALWGAYDLWVKYPYDRWTNEVHDVHRELLDKQESRTISATQPASPDMIAIASRGATIDSALTEVQLLDVFDELTKRHERAAKVSTFDDFVCWMFISCILCVPWALWRVHRLRTRGFTLDDQGLRLPDRSVWRHDEIASIDMSKWMDKSIAWVVHQDGRRVKLDAYLYKHLEHIIGTIAHRFEPEVWNTDGTMVKCVVEEASNAALESAAAEEAEQVA